MVFFKYTRVNVLFQWIINNVLTTILFFFLLEIISALIECWRCQKKKNEMKLNTASTNVCQFIFRFFFLQVWGVNNCTKKEETEKNKNFIQITENVRIFFLIITSQKVPV